jgi:predicted TIM-barrel fold metal-dependent hydrolase
LKKSVLTGKIAETLFIASLLVISGCRNKYYSPEDFVSVLKVDSHVHINNNRGYFEEAAAAHNFVLLTLNVDHSDLSAVKRQLVNAEFSAKNHPGRVFYGATFHFDTAGWGAPGWSEKIISDLDKAITGNAVTVKIWKNIGMTVRDRSGRFIMTDDPGLDRVFQYIRSRGLPVTGHLGEPRNCWLPLDKMTIRGDSSYFAAHPEYHMFLHPDFPSYRDQINARDHLLAKNPDLIFIGCHLGSLEWDVDSLAKRLDRYPNMAVDMAARICHLQYQSARNRNKVRNFCIRYQDRLLYGTDLSDDDNSDPAGFREWAHKTWSDDWKYFVTCEKMTSDNFKGTFEGLQLPRKVVDKIFRENAVKWYKLKINAG